MGNNMLEDRKEKTEILQHREHWAPLAQHHFCPWTLDPFVSKSHSIKSWSLTLTNEINTSLLFASFMTSWMNHCWILGVILVNRFNLGKFSIVWRIMEKVGVEKVYKRVIWMANRLQLEKQIPAKSPFLKMFFCHGTILDNSRDS